MDSRRLCETAAAANVMLCDGEGQVSDIEVCPEGIARFQNEHANCCVHVNHYLPPGFAAYEANSLPDPCPRLDRMRVLIQENWGKITVEVMKRIFADHHGDSGGICRHGAENMHSISSYIAEPAKGVLHVRRGHGCLGTWQAYEV